VPAFTPETMRRPVRATAFAVNLRIFELGA
jgi:hypothetical protein